MNNNFEESKILSVTDEEFGDIVVSIQTKINSLKERRQRYYIDMMSDERWSDPDFRHYCSMMWSKYSQERLDRLEVLLEELLSGARDQDPMMTDYVACPVEEAEDQELAADQSADQDDDHSLFGRFSSFSTDELSVISTALFGLSKIMLDPRLGETDLMCIHLVDVSRKLLSELGDI